MSPLIGYSWSRILLVDKIAGNQKYIAYTVYLSTASYTVSSYYWSWGGLLMGSDLQISFYNFIFIIPLDMEHNGKHAYYVAFCKQCQWKDFHFRGQMVWWGNGRSWMAFQKKNVIKFISIGMRRIQCGCLSVIGYSKLNPRISAIFIEFRKNAVFILLVGWLYNFF